MKNKIFIFIFIAVTSSILSSCHRSGHRSQPWHPSDIKTIDLDEKSV